VGNKIIAESSRLAFAFIRPSLNEQRLFESYPQGGIESGEISAQRPQVAQGGPEGQNLGALLAPCGSLSPMVHRHPSFNHKVYFLPFAQAEDIQLKSALEWKYAVSLGSVLYIHRKDLSMESTRWQRLVCEPVLLQATGKYLRRVISIDLAPGFQV